MFFTYSAHPASCAAADRVLQIMEREALVARAATMGEKLGKRLSRLLAHPERGRRARPRALVGGRARRGQGDPRAVRGEREASPRRSSPRGSRNGIFVYPGGVDPARDVVTLGPPFTILGARDRADRRAARARARQRGRAPALTRDPPRRRAATSRIARAASIASSAPASPTTSPARSRSPADGATIESGPREIASTVAPLRPRRLSSASVAPIDGRVRAELHARPARRTRAGARGSR